jgi:CheY-like chemotaxis protein
MATARDRYGKCESCDMLGDLRFSRSPGEQFSWICVRCRAKSRLRQGPAEADVLQAEKLTSERMLRSAVPNSETGARTASEAEKGTILIVEDDADTRGAECAVLTAAGFSVLQAANGKEGLELLATLAVKPRAILLDLWMPVMNGWDFYELLSRDRELRSIPVIVLTAHDLQSNLNSLKWLKKPIGMDTLLEAVRASCAS